MHSKRDSSIEALKLLAMLCIVISHVVQSLLPSKDAAIALPFQIDYRQASKDTLMWCLVLLRMLGAWGNTIFVISSAWFLCLNDRVNFKKVAKMVLDVFVISVAMLAVFILIGVRPDAKTTLKSFFPTTLANNWFITCYLLLYVIHPALNWIINRLSKRQHAGVSVCLITVYMILPMIQSDIYYRSDLVVMICEYLIIAYARLYLHDTSDNVRKNALVFLICILLNTTVIALYEIAGVHTGILSDKMLHFAINGNPIPFLSAFSIFNLFRSRKHTARAINYASSLLIFVYLIHENILVRQYTRPLIWSMIHASCGYDLLLFEIPVFAIILYAVSMAIACIYDISISRRIEVLSIRLHSIISLILNRIVCSLLSIS